MCVGGGSVQCLLLQQQSLNKQETGTQMVLFLVWAQPDEFHGSLNDHNHHRIGIHGVTVVKDFVGGELFSDLRVRKIQRLYAPRAWLP